MNIKELLKAGIHLKASDIHLLPDQVPFFRIDGDLVPMKHVKAFTPTFTKSLIFSVLTESEQQFFEKEKQFEIALQIPDLGLFRVSLYHQLNGMAAVFRIVPAKVPTFEELSLPKVLKSLCVLANGLILVTGAAGSGKSTTLATMIDYINTFRACNIITIEDPIEFVHQSKKSAISQIQIHRDAIAFPSALRASLRQDPNVILIGELRDLETIRLALTAAETGHLVMATLHASSAPLAVNRIVDVFPDEEKNRVRDLLAETIQAICCQTLVKQNTGGRIAAMEIMIATRAVRHQIRQDKISHIMMTMQTQGDIGMCTMEQSLDHLLAKRLINQNTVKNVLQSRGHR